MPHCYAKPLNSRQLHGKETHWGQGRARKTRAKSYWKPVKQENGGVRTCSRSNVNGSIQRFPETGDLEGLHSGRIDFC